MKEVVFEIQAEGGSLRIERKRYRKNEKFIYHHSEIDLTDEGLGINEKGEYETFEKPFQIINNKFPWFQLHLSTVNEEYRDYVLSELVKALNSQSITPDELKYSKKDLEKVLNIELKFGFLPARSGLQNIKVTNLVKLTEYDYQEFTEESGLKSRLKGKYEVWTDDQPYDETSMNIIREKYGFEVVGKLELIGNTIVIKNEFGQIDYVFPSDKYFVSTTPILSQIKGWYYNTK